MKKTLKTLMCLSILPLLCVATANACVVGGPHLWLSTDSNNFNLGGENYVWRSRDPWQRQSYVAEVADNMPFTMYLYNALKTGGEDAEDIGLIVVVHKPETGEGKTGSVTITDEFGNSQTLTSFAGTDVGPYYGGGNHGVYLPHDGVFAIYKPSSTINLSSDRNPPYGEKKWTSFVISSSSFSEVHFDAFSCNGFWNPASHDVTQVVPEPASLSLIGFGVFCLLKFKRGRYYK